MSTMSLDLTGHFASRLRPSKVGRLLTEWWHNAQSRAELESLDDRSLRDIGITRCTADHEASKPFWIR